ncbi:MAG TPA: HEAT repeat domain-containing protein [Gemmataceae bacterium]|nr:HEAT repeat domain-containing protein [Gemmataceae bacterium]
MRPFIIVATLVGIVAIGAVEGGPPRKEDIPKLINALKTSPTGKARAQAAEDIGARGAIRASDIENAIDPLLSALKADKDADVRKACAKALGGTASYADKCVPALTDALKDNAQPVQIAAAKALGQYGSDAKSALPALQDIAAKKDDKKLSPVAAAAVKQIMGVEKKKKG